MALANVTLSDTFDIWRTRTNQLIAVYDETNTLSRIAYNATNTYVSTTANITANLILSNTIYFNQMLNNANTIVGANAANILTSNTIVMNTFYTNGNTLINAYIATNPVAIAQNTANAAYSFANTVDTTTASAFALANTNNTRSILAYGQANVAYSQANAAFDKANNAVTDYSPAFNHANSAYALANTNNTRSIAAFGQANVAYSQANAAFTKANNAITDYSPAFNQANLAYNLANTINVAYATKASPRLTGNVDVEFGSAASLRLVANRIETPGANASAEVAINYLGFNGGTSQFRDTQIYNGKTNAVALFAGSSKIFTNYGDIRSTNNITAYYSSDIRLKTNIQPIVNALEKVDTIRGVEFDWTDEYLAQYGEEDGYFIRKHDVGVIAQEIEKVLPEVVAERSDGTKAVKYDRIVALLIQAIKELNAEVKKLKGE